MNNRSAACVKVPASATATKYRKCRSSRFCVAAPDGLSASGSRSGVDPVSACVILITFIRPSPATSPGPVSQHRPQAVPGELVRMWSVCFCAL
jgi:hypothetical protein